MTRSSRSSEPPSESQSDLLSDLAESYLSRLRQGENPKVEEYVTKYPELDQGIRQLFSTLVLVERLGDRSGFGGDTPAALAQLPNRLGDFQLEREIARGGMGIVFEAMQLSLERKVAVKVLPPLDQPDMTRLLRFQREARAAASLHHTNIVPVYEVGEQDGICYYAMQYIDGESMAEVWHELQSMRSSEVDRSTNANRLEPTQTESICRRLVESGGSEMPGTNEPSGSGAESAAERHPDPSGKKSVSCQQSPELTRTQGSPAGSTVDPRSSGSNWRNRRNASHREYFHNIARILLQLVEALAYAHSRGILHRDIKPANVILDTQCRAWLTDFGLARLGTDDLTASEHVVGTLRYMSPERFSGKVDARSDVYSAGLVLYEFATMRPAFVAADQAGMMHLIQHVNPTRPRECESTIPKDLETIILCAADKDPARRYAHADAFANDLRRFLEGRPLLARRVPTWEHATRWCQRNPAVAILSGALGCVLIGALVVTTILWRQSQASYSRAEENLKIANSVNSFLRDDLLAQADVSNQASDENRSSSITVRQLLDRAATGIESKFSGQPRTEAAIRYTLGNSYAALGELPKAQAHLERSLQLLQDSAGPADPETLNAINSLAIVYRSRGQYREALTQFKQLLDVKRKKLGDTHPDTLQTMGNLSAVHMDLGEFEHAERLMKLVLDGRKERFGEANELTLVSANNLGNLYLYTGRFEDAEPLLRKTADAMVKTKGDDFPDALAIQGNLGSCYVELKKYDDAEKVYRHVLAIRTKMLGKQHLSTLRSLNDVANVYNMRGQYREAEPLYREVYEGRLAQLGPNHLETLLSLNNLALLAKSFGRLDEAEELFRDVLRGRRQNLGEDHPDTLRSLNQLGELLATRGELEEALPLLKQAAESALTDLGSDHPQTKKYLSALDTWTPVSPQP